MTSTPGLYHLTIYQGTTFDAVITWEVEDGLGVLQPVDLTGYTARMQVRRGYGSAVLLAATTADYITLGAGLGTITFDIPASATAALSFDKGKWDLELVSAGGQVTRLLHGDCYLSREVTV